MDVVCGERRTPTSSRWMSDVTPPLTVAGGGAFQSWLAAQNSAVFDLKITSYVYAYRASRANWSAALEAALPLMGLGLVVRRVFPPD